MPGADSTVPYSHSPALPPMHTLCVHVRSWPRRLFLLCDILHNTTAPVRNVSRYRTRFEAVLPSIFESLHETYR